MKRADAAQNAGDSSSTTEIRMASAATAVLRTFA